MAKRGTLGTVELELAAWLPEDEQYQRRYQPIQAQGIFGDDEAQVTDEVAQWAIDDWSGGDGDVRWRDRGRYRDGTGAGPASDGSGVVVGPYWDSTDTSGTNEASCVARGGGRLVSAGAMDGSIYYWNGSAWASLWAIGGASDDVVVAMAATESANWFVLDNDGDIRKVASGGNSLHYNGGSFDDIAVYDGRLYGIVGVDLYLIDQSSTDTRTSVYDGTGVVSSDASNRIRRLRTSDVGVFWALPMDDGRTVLWEYNVADDVAYVLTELPMDVAVYDILFHNGIYFATYRAAPDHASTGDTFLFYKLGGTSGSMGPLPAVATTASEAVALPGVVGDRVYMSFDHSLWAYDLTSGATVKVADWSSSDLDVAGRGVSYGSELFLPDSSDNLLRIDTRTFKASEAQTLSTGMFDYGYWGLTKVVERVTAALEDPLAASGTVELGWSTDGSAVTWLDDDFATGEGAHTWTVSSSSATVAGVEVEWHFRLTTTSTTVSPKVVSLMSEASSKESRIEWVLRIDVGKSSTQDGKDVIESLIALKNSGDVVAWSDPFEVADEDAPESFDVMVRECFLPQNADSANGVATVRLSGLATVGG